MTLFHGEHRNCFAGLSPQTAERCLLELREAIETVRKGMLPRMRDRVWPDGLDRSILQALPLQVRTWNCLQSAALVEGKSPITLQQLLIIPNFGRKSLQDFLYTVEDFLNGCIHAGNAESNGESEPNERVWTHLEENIIHSARIEASRTAREYLGQILGPLLAAASELQGIKTLADVLNPKFMSLADRMGVADAINVIGIDDVTGGAPGLVSITLDRLSQTVNAMPVNERIVIEQRLLCTPRATLEEIGARIGVTRERIRQIQIRTERKIRSALGNEGRIIATVLKEQFESMVPQDELDQRVTGILPNDQSLATRLLRKILIDEMGFTLNAGMYLDKPATEQLKDIRASTRRFADDVGLLDEREFIESLPDERWQRFWPWVRERCGLHILFGSLTIRDSGKARVKAALILIGHPATREEIAGVCGFGENKTGSHLSVIPSVVKADKNRWALEEWVEDEYEGIVDEIIQRIEEDDGVTTTDRLLKELPDKFGVNPTSVRAYMQTPKFMIRDGWISMASASSIQLRDLDDVIDGRDHGGDPYWVFTVEERFFDGHSVPCVPPEFAKALGCAPDTGERLRIDNLSDCSELSIRWRLASPTGASIGYLAEPLKHLGLKPGQRVRVTIKGPLLVDLSVENENSEERYQANEPDMILKRMIQRRRLV